MQGRMCVTDFMSFLHVAINLGKIIIIIIVIIIPCIPKGCSMVCAQALITKAASSVERALTSWCLLRRAAVAPDDAE